MAQATLDGKRSIRFGIDDNFSGKIWYNSCNHETYIEIFKIHKSNSILTLPYSSYKALANSSGILEVLASIVGNTKLE